LEAENGIFATDFDLMGSHLAKCYAHKMIKVLEKEDEAASKLTHCVKIAAWHKSERYIKKYKLYVIMYLGRMAEAVAQSSSNILVSVKDHY
jgi:hypothetical protein